MVILCPNCKRSEHVLALVDGGVYCTSCGRIFPKAEIYYTDSDFDMRSQFYEESKRKQVSIGEDDGYPD